MKNYKKTIGFSLVELVIIISVVGILISIALPAINKSSRSVKISKTKIRFSQIVNALKSYYNEYGCWPDILTPNLAHSFVDKSTIFSSMLVGNCNYVDDSMPEDLLYLNPKRLRFIDITNSDLYKQNSVIQKDRLADSFNNPAIYAVFSNSNIPSARILQSAFDAYPSVKTKVPADGLNESVVVFSCAEVGKNYAAVRDDAVDVLSWEI
ncbi:MAG: type II secretion system GspH family protein [Puniceicoccales bacterium]|jgi:type II secretory pathway pseudopilin PulG|nr:type II secretion system GspH family protein [Puniceicoccales bacterium]